MEHFFSYRAVRTLCYFLIFWLMSSSFIFSPIRAQNETEEDILSLISRGIEAYHNSQFQDSITFLKSAIDKLSEEAENQQKLAEAYLFLGKCFVISNDIPQAKAAFRNALELNHELTLDEMQDSPKIMKPFLEVKEQVLQEKEDEEGSTAQPISPETPQKDVETSPVLSDLSKDDEPEEGKKWYKKWWIWTAGVVVVGGIALAMGGSGDDDDDSPATVNVNWYP